MTDATGDVANGAAITFAYWLPSASTGPAAGKAEPRNDIGALVALARAAERAGFDYAMSRSRFTADRGSDCQHEPMICSQALLAATERLKVVATLSPGPWAPAVAAEQVATSSRLYAGRAAVSIVSSCCRRELAAIGEPLLDHDECYRRSEEFVRALRGIWSGQRFDFSGDFYRFHDYGSKPNVTGLLPEVFQGGSSRAAKDTAVRVADWYLADGATPEELGGLARDLRSRASGYGRRLKIGVNARVVARESEAAARGVLAQGAGKTVERPPQDDALRSELVGTPCQIAERIMALKGAGADLVLLDFLDALEVEQFGRAIIPLVRELERQQRLTAASLHALGTLSCVKSSATQKAISRWTRADAAPARRDRQVEYPSFEVI